MKTLNALLQPHHYSVKRLIDLGLTTENDIEKIRQKVMGQLRG